MTVPPPRLTAALVAHYRVEREPGQGGMATVYLAHDLRHERKVAVKVLKPELAAVLGAERFVVEIRTTAALQHPHILPLFDSGTADGFLYYVMPFIEGETLRAKLDRETQLGVEDALRITCDVADALDYAHRHGVVHRDVKPENVLLHDGRPVVADFRIALAVSAAAGGRMTETGLSLGTPHYMSPEQATADKDITGRSDIYSLASVLYEMLTGNPPHTGASAQQIIMRIIAEPVEVVYAVPVFGASGPRPYLRGRGPVSEIALGRAGGLSALVPTVVTNGQRRDIWVTPTDAPGDSRPLMNAAYDEGAPAISPDGRWIAYMTDRTGRDEVYVRALEGEGAEIPVSVSGGIDPKWSSDGTELFYRTRAAATGRRAA